MKMPNPRSVGHIPCPTLFYTYHLSNLVSNTTSVLAAHIEFLAGRVEFIIKPHTVEMRREGNVMNAIR